jgi:hypothetical protein
MLRDGEAEVFIRCGPKVKQAACSLTNGPKRPELVFSESGQIQTFSPWQRDSLTLTPPSRAMAWSRIRASCFVASGKL